MTYDDLLAFLDAHWTKGSSSRTIDRYPFDEVEALLAARGHPERGLRVAHVTGSKGKGSVTTLIAALLRAHGLATGAFTSPHLIDVEERIRDGDGQVIGRDELADRFFDVAATARALGQDVRAIWRLFLIVALELFRDRGVGHAAIEVGFGGRFDATNVLHGAVACITPVGLEHVPRLGRTAAEIAAQKVGIVKPGSYCVSAPQRADAAAVIDAGVALAGATLVSVVGGSIERGAGYCVRSLDAGGIVADLATPHQALAAVRIDLLGRHQAENAAVALTATEHLLALGGRRLDDRAVRTALGRVAWPGRLEVLASAPLLVYDGAHTAESAALLTGALADHFGSRRWAMVVGHLSRRDVGAFLRAVAPVCARVIAVPVPGFESLAPTEIAARAAELGLPALTAASVAAAVELAADAPTCVTGTLYLYDQTDALVRRPAPGGGQVGTARA